MTMCPCRFSRTRGTPWLIFLAGVGFLVVSCALGGEKPVSYRLTYDGNGSTGGTVPVDSRTYAPGSSAVIPTLTDRLQKGDESFIGWARSPAATQGEYLPGAVVPITADTTLYAVWHTYALRDIGPSGGWIFYDRASYTGSDWRYLEMAPYATEKTCSWGANTVFLSPLYGTLGSGKEDTAIITAWLAVNDPANPDRAAYYAEQLVSGGYDDWFVPSKTELQEIYYILKRSNLGSLSLGPYWSSTQANANNALVLAMNSDVLSSGGKNDAAKIRPVRRF